MTDICKRIASFRRVACCNISLIVAGLIAVELVFGTWLFGQNFGLLSVPRDVNIRHVLRHLSGEPPARYTRDQYGLRGHYEKPSHIDILAVGGSTTNELYVGDGNTFVDVLRQGLSSAGFPMVVVNAGVDGHSTIGHLRAFDVWFPNIPGLRPKWVIFYIGINDVAVSAQARHDNSITERGGPVQKLIRRFKNDSILYHIFRIVRGAIRARDIRIVHGTDVAAREFPVVLTAEERSAAVGLYRKSDGLSRYRKRLRALIRAVENWKAHAVFVTQFRGDVRLEGGSLRGSSRAAIDAQIKLDRVNAVTLSVCAETNAYCIDLASEIHFLDGDFYDAVHTTPQGSARVGTYLAQKLEPLLLQN